MEKAICFTGHRPDKIGGYDRTPLQDWVRDRLADAIARAYRNGYLQFICGGALGVDWLAAEEVLALKAYRKDIKLILALPFPGYYSKWSVHTIDHFEEEIVAKADKVLFACEKPYAPWKFQKRNEWMVDNSQAVIAVWDGSSGGTANTVRYAQGGNRPIYLINPLTKITEWIK